MVVKFLMKQDDGYFFARTCLDKMNLTPRGCTYAPLQDPFIRIKMNPEKFVSITFRCIKFDNGNSKLKDYSLCFTGIHFLRKHRVPLCVANHMIQELLSFSMVAWFKDVLEIENRLNLIFPHLLNFKQFYSQRLYYDGATPAQRLTFSCFMECLLQKFKSISDSDESPFDQTSLELVLDFKKESTQNDWYDSSSSHYLLIDGVGDASNYPNAKQVWDQVRQPSVIKLLKGFLLQGQLTLAKEHLEKVVADVCWENREKKASGGSFTFCLTLRVNNCLHTFYCGDTHAFLYQKNEARMRWLTPSKKLNSAGGNQNIAPEDMGADYNVISHTHDCDGVIPRDGVVFNHSKLNVKSGDTYLSATDGIFDLFPKKCFRDSDGRSNVQHHQLFWEHCFNFFGGDIYKLHLAIDLLVSLNAGVKQDDRTAIFATIPPFLED